MLQKIDIPMAQQFLADLLKKHRDRLGLSDADVSLDLEYNPEVNAFARYNGPNRYEIVIYSGIIDSLRQQARRFYRWLCLDAMPPGASVSPHLDAQIDSATEPLVEAGLYSCFYHEIGHIVCNHLDYAYSEFGISELSASRGAPKLDCITHHALEYQADAFFAQHSLLTFPNDHQWLIPGPGGKPNVFFGLGIAMTLLMDALSEHSSSLSDHLKLRHPHPAVRWRLAAHSVMLRERAKLEGYSEHAAAWLEGAELARHIIEVTSAKHCPDRTHWTQESVEVIQEFTNAIFEKRNELRSKTLGRYGDLCALEGGIYV